MSEDKSAIPVPSKTAIPMPSESPEEGPPAPIEFSEFLEGTPPGQSVPILHLVGALTKHPMGGDSFWKIERPGLELYCANDLCNGPRIFRYKNGETTVSQSDPHRSTFLTFLCSNCRWNEKTFSIHVDIDQDGYDWCFKYGESPPFGPPTPTRLLRLFGADRELFLRGRQCENQGLGIGAFVYYRRVVESHRDQILDEVIKVSKKVGASESMLNTLEGAKKEQQFSKALESLKDAIPQALLINGQNPLTLLHAALSGGLHGKSDDECLELAHAVRVVLAELADRLSQLLKDEAELKTAVSRLLQARQNGEPKRAKKAPSE